MYKRRVSDDRILAMLDKPQRGFSPNVRKCKWWRDGALLVDYHLLTYAMSHRKTAELRTYALMRHFSYLNAGLISKEEAMTLGISQATLYRHIRFLLKAGWLRKLKHGQYQIVSAQRIASSLSGGKPSKTAVPIKLEEWQKGRHKEVVFAAYLSCLASFSEKKPSDFVTADELKGKHFVAASSVRLSKKTGLSTATVRARKKQGSYLSYFECAESIYGVWSRGMAENVERYVYPRKANGKCVFVQPGPDVFYSFRFFPKRRCAIR